MGQQKHHHPPPHLIGGFNPLKNMKARLDHHPNYWGILKNMFQTTNQGISWNIMEYESQWEG